MSSREQPESGVFTGRAEFYRESVTGVRNADPAFQFFSDNPREVNHSPGLNIERRDGLGTPDAVAHDIGNEEPEIELVYDAQRDFVDNNDDPDDALADALLRNADNRIKNTHHVRIREERETPDPDDPSDTDGARVYIIGDGCHPNVEAELDPENGAPVLVTLTYVAEKVRKYEVLQPDGTSGIAVVSSDGTDTSQTLTLEDDEGTSEDVSLDGTNPVGTTKSDWSSLRALELDAETTGDVTIAVNDGDETSPTMGSELATIRGADYYSSGDNEVEGDLGVQAIGSGSQASAINSSYVYFNGADVTRGGSSLDYDLNRMTLTCENNYEPTPRHDSTRMRWNEGNRLATLESDVVGWGASANYHDEALGINGEDIVLKLGGNQLTLHSAVPSEPGDTERASDDSAIEYSVTFEPSSDDGGVSLTQV